MTGTGSSGRWRSSRELLGCRRSHGYRRAGRGILAAGEVLRMGQQRRRVGGAKAERDAASRALRAPRRGRPPKFGRPSQLVALTLPEDVLDVLRALHRDPAWAIVRLVESISGKGEKQPSSKSCSAIADLVRLPGNRGLIVVEPQAVARLRGVSTIPLADGRAFLAFDHPAGLADLEVAIIDRLEAAASSSGERGRLTQILDAVRRWRRDRKLVFRARSIIVVEAAEGVAQRSLGRLLERGADVN
jgi:hypothetical protein